MLLVVESEARTGEACLTVDEAELLVAAEKRAVEVGVAGDWQVMGDCKDTLPAPIGCVEAVREGLLVKLVAELGEGVEERRAAMDDAEESRLADGDGGACVALDVVVNVEEREEDWGLFGM